MAVDRELLEMLACPECHGAVRERPEEGLECRGCGRVYPIRDGIPVLLLTEASPSSGDSAD